MTSTENATRRGPWFLRALPATVLALALVALAALLSPGFRHQLVVSTTHRSEPYVELYFARAPGGTPAVCLHTRDTVQVEFVVASHLPERRDLAYEVSVDGAVQTGSADTSPGGSVTVGRSFDRPRGPFDVSVHLPGLDQQLLAHCDGARG